MLVSYVGGLQCLTISLSLALFITCSHASLNSTSTSVSMSSRGPPYGNTTSTTFTPSSKPSYSDSSTTLAASSIYHQPTDSTGSLSSTSDASILSSGGSDSSMITQTISGATPSSTDFGSSTPTASGKDTLSILMNTTKSESTTGETSTSSFLMSSGGTSSSSKDSGSSITASASLENGTSISRFPASNATSAITSAMTSSSPLTDVAVVTSLPPISGTGASASFDRTSESTPVSSLITILVGNSTSLVSTGHSGSVSMSSVLGTRTTADGSGTGLLPSPTSSINGTSPPMVSITTQNTPSTGNATGEPSSTIPYRNSSSLPSITGPSWNSTSAPSVSATGSPPTLRLNIGTFKYLGCASSSLGFATFFQIDSTVSMTLELCISECGVRQYNYAGVFVERCYCGNSLSSDIIVTPGQGSCNILCPGDMTEFCGGQIAGSERGLEVRQLQVISLLSLFANLAANTNLTGPSSTSRITSTDFPSSGGSGNSTIHSSTSIISSIGTPSGNGFGNISSSSSSVSAAPSTTAISGIGLGNSSAPSGSNKSAIDSTIAPFTNRTSSLLPGSQAPSSLSSTILTSSTRNMMSVGANFTVTTTYTVLSITKLETSIYTGFSSPSSSAATLGVYGSSSFGRSGNTISENSTANLTSFIGYTITEIVYTATSTCPTTVNTVISGMPANIITNSLSTIILTSTIMVPCHKCLKPSQIITLQPTATTSALGQIPSSRITNVNEVIVTEIVYTTISTCPITTETSVSSGSTLYFVTEKIFTLTLTTTENVNEVVVTEIIYTTVSTCPITTGTSILSGSTWYDVVETISTLTLTATTTAPCQRCRPGYATVTIMLVGGSATGNLGPTTLAFPLPSTLVILSAQSAVNSASSANCPGCTTIGNENVGVEAMGIPSSPAYPASFTSNSAPSAQVHAEGTIYGGGPAILPAESIATSALNLGLETAGIATIPVSTPESLSHSTQANVQGQTDTTGDNITPTAGATLTAAPVNLGPYFTGGSKQNLNNISQAVALGLTLITVMLLSMI